MRGHGETTIADEVNLDVGELTADVLSVVENLQALLSTASGPPALVLVGHSMGGAVATRVAASGPTHLRGLVVIDVVEVRSPCTHSQHAYAGGASNPAAERPRHHSAFHYLCYDAVPNKQNAVANACRLANGPSACALTSLPSLCALRAPGHRSGGAAAGSRGGPQAARGVPVAAGGHGVGPAGAPHELGAGAPGQPPLAAQARARAGAPRSRPEGRPLSRFPTVTIHASCPPGLTAGSAASAFAQRCGHSRRTRSGLARCLVTRPPLLRASHQHRLATAAEAGEGAQHAFVWRTRVADSAAFWDGWYRRESPPPPCARRKLPEPPQRAACVPHSLVLSPRSLRRCPPARPLAPASGA